MFKSKVLDRLCQSPLVSKCLTNTVGRLSGLNLFLPMYHTVQAKEALPHISHLYNPHSIEKFEADLTRWLKTYEPLSLEDMEAISSGRKSIRRPSIFLTFDDGLREVYDHALPVLTRLGVPSAVFVNSNFVDNTDLFFRYTASLLVDSVKSSAHELPVVRRALQIVSLNHEEKHATFNKELETLSIESIRKRLIQAILSIKYQEKERLLTAAECLDVDIRAFLNQQKPYMTTTQLRAAKSQGMAIGAHSVDHPLYRDLASKQQYWQTYESLKYVCEEFGMNRSSFAFPFSDSGVTVSQMKELLNIQNGSLIFGGQGFRSDIDSRIFHRQSMEIEASSTESVMARYHIIGMTRKIARRTHVSRDE